MFNFIARAAEDSEASEGIVSCSGLDCNVCELVKTVVNIFQLLTWISAAVAILFIVIGGFIYIGARGNELLMSQAKKTIIWAIVGFALVLLAFLGIKATYKVVGATNEGFWEEIDCDADTGILGSNKRIAAIPEQSAASLIRGAKNGGIAAGKLKMEAGSNELGQLVENLDEDKMAIFAAAGQSEKKPIMAIGKKNNQPELLYVDRSLINQLLKSTGQLLISSVYAQTAGNNQINELLAEITQVVQRLIEKNQELLVIITQRTNIGSGENSLGNVPVSTIHNITNKVSQCFNSGGYWFMFSDTCKAAEQNCNPVKCSVQSDFSLTAGCQCPEDKCLSGSNCVDKKQ